MAPGTIASTSCFRTTSSASTPHIEAAINRVPAFGEVGVKEVYNGAIPYTPDGSPIIGPAWGLRNFWLNEGHSFGITAAGGAGWQLAEWIVEGEPTIDMLGVDPRRFGDYATKGYLRAKNEEAYANVFTIHYPDEERAAGRPLRTAPCYERMKALGAVFGQKFGWERPNWFAPAGTPQEDHWSFRRSRWFEPVRRRVPQRLRERRPARHDRVRQGARLRPGRGGLPRPPGRQPHPARRSGRLNLCHALNSRGGVHSEFTIFREGPDSFYLVSAGAWQRLDHDWLQKHMPEDGSVRFDNLTDAIGVLVVAGPKARELMERVSDEDFSSATFPWLTGREILVGLAPTKALRVNFVGELGWELHHPLEYQNHIFDRADGGGRGSRPQAVRHPRDGFPAHREVLPAGRHRALDRVRRLRVRARSLRPSEQGRLHRPRRAGALARAGLCQPLRHARGARRRPMPTRSATTRSTPTASWSAARPAATTAFACRNRWRSPWCDPAHAEPGTDLEMDILGTRHPVTVIPESPYDPENLKLRS